jgi:hypothetical protein
VIISASYKTDIPAFYGRWFMNRLRAGNCVMVNPYNRKPRRVSLSPEDVDGIVFWTKNLRPFLKHLPEIRNRGFAFVVQYTITGYPRELERSVVHAQLSIEHMRRLAAEYGQRVGVWRYDTILFTSTTTRDYHRRQFEQLARQLEGLTDEVVVSFAQMYRKTKSNLDTAARQHGFEWNDPADDIKRALAAELAQMAKARGMRLSMCAQRHYLVRGVADASCIDARRLSDILGRTVRAAKKGNRKDCGCYAAVDIGEYDTCPHGCVYCYAVTNQASAKRHHKAHDPESESLSTAGCALPVAQTHHHESPMRQMQFGL